MEVYSKEYRHLRAKKRYIWKKWGLVENIDELFNLYWNTNECQQCGVELKGLGCNKKCLDHDHTTGLFRRILCHSCNVRELSNRRYLTNKSGYKNIYYDNRGKRWVYCKIYKGKKYVKTGKEKIPVLVGKFAYILLTNWKFKNNL